MLGRRPRGVSRQWAVVVRYGMRHVSACQADFEGSWALLLNKNSRELVPITNRSGCKWIAKPRWRCPYCSKFKQMVLLSAATKPIWSGPTATCPVTTLYNKASLRSRRRSLRSRQPRSCSIWVTLDVVLWSPLTNLADRRCIFSNKSQSLAKWGSQTGAAYSNVERTNEMYAVSLRWSQVRIDSGPVRPCGPVPFAVTLERWLPAGMHCGCSYKTYK